ncbi:hypothetical protein FQN50_004093 [Emmonsiellopsis sp. PD_5]|nr:hypothetical protein FQN50_004093 [Emmonsiellopsis sp. PD_5]
MAAPEAELLYGRSLNTLFRRCVVNCPSEPPPCPSCAEDETCMVVSQSCNACQDTVCTPLAAIGKSPPKQKESGTNVGAIAGGVVGGIAIIAVIALIWWCTRKKRKNTTEQSWDASTYEKRDTLGTNRRARQSAVGSIASTVLTRASNVIQIAYIPGVTNRSPPDTPGVLVPPVPPLPTAAGSTYSQDQHFFMPGDIRDSVWSEMTEDDRKSISPSLARSSVATTIYRNNAIVSPVPAQQALRGKAAVVSVKSGANSPMDTPRDSTVSTPAVPPITASQIDKANAVAAKVDNANSGNKFSGSIVARSMVARPINVTKSPRSKPSTISEGEESNNPKITVSRAPSESDVDSLAPDSRGRLTASKTSSNDNPSDDEATSKAQRRSDQSATTTVIEDSPAAKQSPFDDSHSSRKNEIQASTIPEEGENSSSKPHRSSQRSMSPFGDENEVKP